MKNYGQPRLHLQGSSRPAAQQRTASTETLTISADWHPGGNGEVINFGEIGGWVSDQVGDNEVRFEVTVGPYQVKSDVRNSVAAAKAAAIEYILRQLGQL